ncbi:MAG TPA: hypothetical protein VIN38_04490 [Thiobacillus sp.]
MMIPTFSSLIIIAVNKREFDSPQSGIAIGFLLVQDRAAIVAMRAMSRLGDMVKGYHVAGPHHALVRCASVSYVT